MITRCGGVHAGRDRSKALFGLALETPAAILARTLGLRIKVAVAWQEASAGDWMVCAAIGRGRSRWCLAVLGGGFTWWPAGSPLRLTGEGCRCG